MPKYDVYIICGQCGNPHPVNVNLTVDDASLDRTRLSEYFNSRPLPSAIAFMQTNKYRCPHTKMLFPASDLDQAIFFSASDA